MDIGRRQRPMRYALSVPVLYRGPNDAGWLEATAVDMSCRGLLVVTGQRLPEVGTPISFVVQLPGFTKGRGVEVHGTGRVVRRETSGECGSMALAVDRCDMLPWSAAQPS